jgi:hypothetical protein
MEPLHIFKGDQRTLRVFKNLVELEMPKYYFSAPFSSITAIQVEKNPKGYLTLNAGGLEAKYYGTNIKEAYNAINS